MKHALLTAGGAVAVAFLLPGTAHAHVSVSPKVVEPGGYATLTLKVPTERDDASTTRVEMVLPTDIELSSLSTRPVPGWTATISRRTGTNGEQVPSGVVWTGGQIKPGEFQAFDVSLGRLPADPGTLVLKAVQTYSSGEVVRWIETPADGAPEPKHPAPTLTLAKAAPAAAAAPVAAPVAAAVAAPEAGADADALARGLGVAGLVAGLLAVSVAARRRTQDAPLTSVGPDARVPERLGR
jgi:uncharacterized protein YcnI